MREPLTERHDGGNGKKKIVRTYGRNKVKSAVSQENKLDIFLDGGGLGNALSKLRIDERKASNSTHHDKKRSPSSEEAVCDSSPEPSKSRDQQAEQSSDQGQTVQNDEQPNDSWLNPLLQLSDRGIMSFGSYASKLSKAYNVQKIGEGSFSSVFSLSEKNSDNGTHERSIIKIIPIRALSSSDEGDQSDVGSIVNEMQTMSVLDEVPGFLRYRGVMILQGLWPTIFLEAFRIYCKRCRSKALNEDPEEAYTESQHYAVIEMGCAGQELDEITRPSDFQMFDIFWMTTINLALAEERLEFEHRDLHVSNICIKAADLEEARTDVLSETVKTMTKRPQVMLGLTNIELTLIDYTYSRTLRSVASAEVDKQREDGDREAAIADEKKRKEEVLQQSTYAKANECIASKRAEQGLSKGDPVFAARTNVCWLSYLIHILLGRAGKIARTKYIQSSNTIAKGVQDELRSKSKEIAQSLSCSNIDELPGSALEVLNIGLEKGWLSKLDVDAFRLRLEAYEHS